MTPEYREALIQLLLELADDDLLIGFRAGEWLGLGPHIEEDIAYASIGQDELGHAMRYYQLLEEFGCGRRDDLAMLRPAQQRKNSVLAEWPNGSGHFMDNPQFDWGFTMARHYCLDVWEMVRLDGLVRSNYSPLAQTAQEILLEKPYHRAHQQQWLQKMALDPEVAQTRLAPAVALALELAGDLMPSPQLALQWEELGIWPQARKAGAVWEQQTREFLKSLGIMWRPVGRALNGREGMHSPHLESALALLSEVYRTDPTASW